MNRTYLKRERIVVTGAGGFLGKHLCNEFLRQNVEIVPVLRDNYDLRSELDVASMYQVLEPTIVIHLAAACGGIGANRNNPGRFFYENMAMGLHLIEHAKINNVKKFVQIGTVCAYPKITPVPFKEDSLWNGYPEETNAPYGIAKKSLLVMLQAYRSQYGLNGIYLIPANLYGEGDNFDPGSSHVIPAMIYKFCDAVKTGKDEVELWGSGEVSREFLNVKDAARAIVMATEFYDGSEPVNVGTGEEILISDLAVEIARLSGFKGTIRWNVDKPNGQPRRCLDVSRARDLFGFEAQIELKDGLEQAVNWYKANN